MRSLENLRDTWFLDVDNPTGFPPQSRHPGALVHPFTDGNHITPILSGAAYMARFYEIVQEMIDADDPTVYELWVHAWRIEPVKLLGEVKPGPTAEELLESAARAGVLVRFLASGHDLHARDVADRINEAGGKAAVDRRVHGVGSHHQKFVVFRGPDNSWRAILGSGDFLFARWDTAECNPEEPARPPNGYPTHDVWLEIEGPAVHDVALHFAERWNDPEGRLRTHPRVPDTIQVAFARRPPPAVGGHSLQILRTYSVLKIGGFTWSDQGEFTIWAAYLNAIYQSTRYIYLEDQYFYSFRDRPLFNRPSDPLHKRDIVYHLGEAIKRGVDVVVVVPSRKSDWRKHYELQQRGRAVGYLAECATLPNSGRFIGCFLRKGDKDPIVHSKLMLVDDEYAIVGSANIGMRSMSYDSEVCFGLVDGKGRLVADLRSAIWAKHMDLPNPMRFENVDGALDVLEKSADDESGRLRRLPKKLVRIPFPYGILMDRFIDPYGGPKKIDIEYHEWP